MPNQELLYAPEKQVSLETRAQRIRDLVNVTRVLIIEVGRELIAAKESMNHGDWLPWLKENFGWTDQTARNYMKVAEAFKSQSLLDFKNLSITGEALYLLSGNGVSDKTRSEAIEKAKVTTVTLKEAQKMVKDAQDEMTEEVKEQLKKLREKAEEETEKRIAKATEKLGKENLGLTETVEKLEKEIEEIHAEDEEVTEQDAIALVKKITGASKLSMDQMGGICFALGKPLPPKIADHFAERVGPVDGTDGKVHGPLDEVDDRATWIWGRLLEVEQNKLLKTDPLDVASKMDKEMKVDTLRVIGKFSDWLLRLQRSLEK